MMFSAHGRIWGRGRASARRPALLLNRWCARMQMFERTALFTSRNFPSQAGNPRNKKPETHLRTVSTTIANKMPQAGLTGSKQVRQATQYAAVDDYVAGKKELGDAMDRFCQPAENEFMSSGSTEEVEEHLTISWRAIIAQAAQVSFKDAAQQKLVHFVLGLRSRPTLEKDGQVCQVQGLTVWKDLPTFGMALRNAWNLAAGENSEQESKDQWVNLNAFTASLLATSYPQTGDDLGLSLFCIWTLRQALEESRSVPDVATAAASSWFVFAAPTIHGLCGQGKSFDGKVAQAGPAVQDQDWTGFSQDRWQTWSQKLEQTQGQASDDTTKELVGQARQAISEIR